MFLFGTNHVSNYYSLALRIIFIDIQTRGGLFFPPKILLDPKTCVIRILDGIGS